MVVNGNIIDGRAIANNIIEDLMPKIKKASALLGRRPTLLGIESGSNPDTAAYIRSQQRLAQRLGVEYRHRQVGPYQEELNNAVLMANRDESIDGVILHTPMPPGVDVFNSLKLLKKEKDVEGLSPENVFGLMFRQEDTIFPTTPRAVVHILDAIGVDLYGKEVVIIGQGAVVGRPLSLILAQRRATVTVCHYPTYDRGLLPEHISRAEVLVSAVGKAGLVKGEWIREGSVVIDVGINFVSGKMVGDVEFDTAKDKADLITPVPGGVGPVTSAVLMENLYLLVAQKLGDRVLDEDI